MFRIRNLVQFRRQLSKTSKELRKAGIKTQKDAATFMVINAQRLAPYSTGETIQGIRKRRVSRYGYRVVSEVSGAFKQNLFSNQKSPFRTIRFGVKGGRNFYAPNQVVIYGGQALSRSGNQIRWTGTPRWFDRAAQLTQKQYVSFAVRNTKQALNTTIR